MPLALRGLLDLHEEGDSVLEELTPPEEDEIPLAESDAVRRVIEQLTDRWLLNLEDEAHPEREEALRDITALALLPAMDHRALKAFWSPEDPFPRLRRLSQRYSLLSDGDLHPTVRACLRRRWRAKELRHALFDDVLAQLDSHRRASIGEDGEADLSDRAARVAALSAELNLRSWREGEAVLPDLARAVCLARAYEADSLVLELLLQELPLGPKATPAQAVLRRRLDESERPSDADFLPWLRAERARSSQWKEEEQAALALLEGIQFRESKAPAQEALAAFANLEQAMKFFGGDALPKAGQAGEAYFRVGKSLDPYSPHGPSPDSLSVIEKSYRYAIQLRAWKSSAYNNLANLFGQFLQPPEEGERLYWKAIEADPQNAFPHLGLGHLYQHYLSQPKKAEEEYRKAIELDPKMAQSHHGLAKLYQDDHSEPTKAEEEYQKAIELDPQWAQPHHGLGNLYQYYLSHPHKAEKEYYKAIELEPKAAHPHHGLGNLYQEYLSEPKKAEEEYRKAIELDPTNGGSQRGLAWLALQSSGSLDEARHWAEEARAVDSNHPGTLLAELGVAVWANEWTDVTSRFADWVAQLPDKYNYFPWASRHRVAALLRKASEAGRLEDLGVPLLAHAARACWEPWAAAVEAVLAGRGADALSDPRAREVYELMVKG